MNSDESISASGGSATMAERSPAFFASKPSDAGGVTGSFHPLPFLFKDAGSGMVVETGSGTLYGYKRVELEVDLTEPLHNLLDDLLPHSPTDLDDVILLMCGRKQLSLSTTFQDFTYQGINGTRAKVKLDLLWNPCLQPNNRAGGRLTGGQTIINIDDLYRIVDEADPLYWLNTNASSADATSSGRSTNSTTLLNSQYSYVGRIHQHSASSPSVPSIGTAAQLPPLSPPNSGAQVISPPSHDLPADAMMSDEMDAERNHSNACDDVVQQRDLIVSVAAGNAFGNCSTAVTAAADTDASTAALTPSSGAGTGSVGEGGRRSRGSHRSGASFCGSLPSSTGNALNYVFPDTGVSGAASSASDHHSSDGTTPANVNTAGFNASRKRRRKPLSTSTASITQQLPVVKAEESEAIPTDSFDSVASSDAEKSTVRRRVSSKRPRRSVPVATDSWRPGRQEESLPSSSPSPFVKAKSASPSADYLMSVSTLYSNDGVGMNMHSASGPTSLENDRHNQLFQFSSALLSPRYSNIIVEPREVNTAASSLSSPEDVAKHTSTESAAIPSSLPTPKPATKKRRPSKKPRRPVSAAAGEAEQRNGNELEVPDDVREFALAAAHKLKFDPSDPDNVVTPCGIVKKKRTIGANSYYAYSLGQTFDAVGKNIQLWQYLLELLMDPPRYQRSIEWMDSTGTFTLKEPERVAFLWGERKGSKKRKSESMSYENMSRALRYYYGEILDKVPSKQFTYRFINLKERIGHEPDEMFGFARSRALAVGLQLPSGSAGGSSTPSSALLEPSSSEQPSSERACSPSAQHEIAFTFSENGAVDANPTTRESPQQLPAAAEGGVTPQHPPTGVSGADAVKKARSAKRTSTKRKKPMRPINSSGKDAVQQQQSSNSNDVKSDTTPEPASSIPASTFSKSFASACTTVPTTANNHFTARFPLPTSNAGSMLVPASNGSNNPMQPHFPQFSTQQQQRFSPNAMVEMMRNAANNNNNGAAAPGAFNNTLSPQNLNLLLHQLATNNNNGSGNSTNNTFQAPAANHFGLVSPALEEALLQQQQSQRNLLPPHPSQQPPMPNNQITPTPAQTQILAQLFQQHQQQQNFMHQQQNSNNSLLLNSNANRNNAANCITLPGVGTINLSSLMPQQQQQVAPNMNNNSGNPLNNALMSAVLAASSGSAGSNTNIADGMRNLLAKVAEGGSQVNQLMAAVGLATLLSSAQQQQPSQQQTLASLASPPMNSNTIAQVFALLQQQQQQQQTQHQNSTSIPPVSVNASSAAASCPPFMGLFGLRS